MTKTKIFMAAGSLVLACGAFMAAKPAKKFTTFKTAIAKSPFLNVAVVGTAANYFTTVDNNHTAFIGTRTGGSQSTLFTSTGALAAKAYVK